MTLENLKIFRAYDVRGIYEKEITENTAELIGKSFGTYLGERKKIAVSRDFRNGGKELKQNLIHGLTSVGCDVVDIETVTTPMMYFAVIRYELDGGIQVTASHNPPEYNGFKMAKKKAILCSEGFGMEEIKSCFIKENFTKPETILDISKKEIQQDYEDFMLSKIRTLKKLKIVLDPGNGAACGIAEHIFTKAGYSVLVINGEPDGRFPARSPDPTEKAVNKLMEEVVRTKSDMGIAFDGDADRVAFVDNLGNYISSGNVTIPIFAEYYLKNNKKGKIVYDICSSSSVEDHIRSNGGTPLVNRVGHSFVMNRVVDEGAVFGGENSGHLYFSEIYGIDDALYAGLKMAEIISSQNLVFSEFIKRFLPKYFASNVSEIHCNDNFKFEVVKKIRDRLSKDKRFKIIDIDGVKVFDDHGDWFLIRSSNTAEAIKINSEAKTAEKMKSILEYAESLVKEEIENN